MSRTSFVQSLNEAMPSVQRATILCDEGQISNRTGARAAVLRRHPALCVWRPYCRDENHDPDLPPDIMSHASYSVCRECAHPTPRDLNDAACAPTKFGPPRQLTNIFGDIFWLIAAVGEANSVDRQM
jgi:hypothetical protein